MFEQNNEPEDMFADVDPSATPSPKPPTGGTAPASPTPSDANPPNPTLGSGGTPGAPVPSALPSTMPEIKKAPEAGKLPGGKKGGTKSIVIVVIVVVVVVVVGILAYFLLSARTTTPTVPQAPDPIFDAMEADVMEVDDAMEADVVEEDVIEEVTPPPAPVIDTDKDGLSDAQEAELGTSPTSTDTDADGLFDREEVEIYGTNPINPDTDGDGFLDGDEVKAGYDPTGPGRLLELPDSK